MEEEEEGRERSTNAVRTGLWLAQELMLCERREQVSELRGRLRKKCKRTRTAV